MPAGFPKSPCTSLILGDSAVNFWAAADEVFRVTARISNGALRERRLLITAPPCFPVAPVMRIGVIVEAELVELGMTGEICSSFLAGADSLNMSKDRKSGKHGIV